MEAKFNGLPAILRDVILGGIAGLTITLVLLLIYRALGSLAGDAWQTITINVLLGAILLPIVFRITPKHAVLLLVVGSLLFGILWWYWKLASRIAIRRVQTPMLFQAMFLLHYPLSISGATALFVWFRRPFHR